MKKIFLFILVLICFKGISQNKYNPSRAGVVQNAPTSIAQYAPTDSRTYKYDSVHFTWRPYVDTIEVLRYLYLPKYRAGQFPIIVNTGGALTNGVITGGTNTEWWFKNGLLDSNLVIKQTGGSGSVNLDSIRNATSITVSNPTGTPAIFQGATEAKAGPIVATDQTKINKVNFANSYTELTTFSTYDTKIAYQYRYNGTADNLYYVSGSTATIDSAMVFPATGGRLIRFVQDYIDVRWFGAVGDNSTNNYYQIQKAINYCIYNNYNRLFIPGGIYRNYTKGWNVWKDANNDGNPEFVYLDIIGQSTANGSGIGNETVLMQMYNDGFTLNLERAKGIKLANIVFMGTNQLNYSPTTAFNGASFNLGVRFNYLSPNAAIVFDAIGSPANVIGTDRYPGFESLYDGVIGGGGSTDCHIENVMVNGYYTGIAISPTVYIQNNENHTFDHMWFYNCYNAQTIYQLQSRNIRNVDWKVWGSVHTIFYCPGDAPIVENLNVANGIIEIFNGAGNNLKMNAIHAEQLYSIGNVGSTKAMITNSYFHFADGVTDNFRYQDNLMQVSGNLIFKNCELRYDLNPDSRSAMNILITNGVASVTFDDCQLNNEFSVTKETPYESQRIFYKGTTAWWNMNGSLRDESEDYYNQEFSLQTGNSTQYVYPGKSWDTYNPKNKVLTQKRMATSNFVRWLDLGTLSLTVSGNSATAVTGVANDGKYQYLNNLVVKALTDSSPYIFMQVARLDSLSASGTYYFDKVIKWMRTGSYQLYYPVYSTVAPMALGSVTAGSNVVSNVISEVNGSAVTYTPGTLVFISGQPYRVVTSSSGTFTVDNNFSVTNSRVVMSASALTYTEYGTSNVIPSSNGNLGGGEKILFTKGSIYANNNIGSTDTAAAWLCDTSGITNTAYPPHFIAITKSGAGGSGTPAGSNTQIQYNNSGAFGATANLAYSGTLDVANSAITAGITVNNSTDQYSTVDLKSSGTSGLLMGSAGASASSPYVNNAFLVYSKPLVLITSGSEKFRFTTSGDFGIGTTPSKRLHMYKNIDGDNTLLIDNPNAGSSAYAGIEMENDVANGAYVRNTSSTYGFGVANTMLIQKVGGPISFYTAFDALRVTAAGKIGINNSSPSAWLDLKSGGATSATYAALFANSSSTTLMSVRDDGLLTVPLTPTIPLDTTNNKIVVKNAAGDYKSTSWPTFGTGYTISQIRDSLQLDTTWHSRTFQSTTATTFNVDTVYFTGAINETLRITCEMFSVKTDGSSYQATRSMSYTITSAGTITDGSPQTDRPKQLVGLSTYDFALVRTGGRMFIQCTSESGTIDGKIWYQVQRQKH